MTGGSGVEGTLSSNAHIMPSSQRLHSLHLLVPVTALQSFNVSVQLGASYRLIILSPCSLSSIVDTKLQAVCSVFVTAYMRGKVRGQIFLLDLEFLPLDVLVISQILTMQAAL